MYPGKLMTFFLVVAVFVIIAVCGFGIISDYKATHTTEIVLSGVVKNIEYQSDIVIVTKDDGNKACFHARSSDFEKFSKVKIGKPYDFYMTPANGRLDQVMEIPTDRPIRIQGK